MGFFSDPGIEVSHRAVQDFMRDAFKNKIAASLGTGQGRFVKGDFGLF